MRIYFCLRSVTNKNPKLLLIFSSLFIASKKQQFEFVLKKKEKEKEKKKIGRTRRVSEYKVNSFSNSW